MALIEEKFRGVRPGQVWKRKRPRTPTSPHILVLALGTRYGIAVKAVKARLYSLERDKIGSATVYPYLENMGKNYEYLGVLLPEPAVGETLVRADGGGYYKVVGISATHCRLIDWDKWKRKRIGKKVHRFLLGASFWRQVDVFWTKRKQVRSLREG